MSSDRDFIKYSTSMSTPLQAERGTLLKQLSVLNRRRAARLADQSGKAQESRQLSLWLASGLQLPVAPVQASTATEGYTAGRQDSPEYSAFISVHSAGITQPSERLGVSEHHVESVKQCSAALTGKQTHTTNKQSGNAVYVRRHRQRQKQMVDELQRTLQERMQQVQQLQSEQHQLIRKHQAMKQVLTEQDHVLQMLRSSSYDAFESMQDGEQCLQPQVSPAAVHPAHASGSSGPSDTSSSLVSGPQGRGSTGAAAEVTAPAVTASIADAIHSMQSKLHLAGSPQQLREQTVLMLLTRQWLEPIKYYVLQSALWLARAGKLPTTFAAEAAAEAAARCAAGYDLKKNLTEVAGAVKDAVAAAANDQFGTSAVIAARLVSTAVRSAWTVDVQYNVQDGVQDGVQDITQPPPISFPYAPSAYVMIPDQIKDLALPMNMDTWQIGDGNSQQHMELAARAMWQSLTRDRWHLLRDAWLAMGQQLEQVQKDLQIVRDRLRTMAADHKTNSSDGKQHGESFDGFASVEESRAYEYAATAVEVERLLMREHAISHQVCGATLRLLTAEQVAVGFVGCWPYHPHVFTLFDMIFKLGEPPK